MFDRLMTEQLILVKKNSRRIEGIKASVHSKICINNISIPVEEDDIFEYTNPAGITNHLRVTRVVYVNHPRLGHIEIDYQKVKTLYRVYLDTNIVARVNDFRIKEKDAKALRLISEKIDSHELELFTSQKAKEEIERIKENTQMEYLLFICNLVKKVPSANLVESVPSAYGQAPFGVATYCGSYEAEDHLYKRLKTVFDKNDAEHIFHAEKAKMDFFLTLDKKSIIDRISKQLNEFRRIGLRMNIMLPSDLLDVLENIQ